MTDEVDARLSRLETQLSRLSDLVERLDARLDARLDTIASDTAVMARHVSFVESVYEQVKRPFFFLMGAVDRHAPGQAPERIAAPPPHASFPPRVIGDSFSNTSLPPTSRSS